MGYRLVVLRGRSESEAIPLPEGITIAGRQEDCGLRIASSLVSRRHCQLFEQKGYLIVRDLGSSNGTFVNGKRVQGQQVVESGAELDIGPIKFRVEKIDAPASAAVGSRKLSDTAVGGSVTAEPDTGGPIPIAIEGEEPAAGATPTQRIAAPAQPRSTPSPSEAETVEFGEEDVADFLLELDVDDDDRS